MDPIPLRLQSYRFILILRIHTGGLYSYYDALASCFSPKTLSLYTYKKCSVYVLMTVNILGTFSTWNCQKVICFSDEVYKQKHGYPYFYVVAPALDKWSRRDSNPELTLIRRAHSPFMRTGPRCYRDLLSVSGSLNNYDIITVFLFCQYFFENF